MKAIITTCLIMLATGIAILLCFTVFSSLVLAFVCYYLGFGIVLPCLDLLLIGKLNFKDFLAYLGLQFSLKNLLWGLISGILIFLVINLFVFFFKDFILSGNTILSSMERWGMGAGNVILVFIIMLLFNGALEEIYWRGYIHRRLEGVKSRPLALALVVLFFTCQHIVIIIGLLTTGLGIFIFLLGIAIGGLFWQIMREYTKSTLACALSHIFATAGYMTVFYVHVL